MSTDTPTSEDHGTVCTSVEQQSQVDARGTHYINPPSAEGRGVFVNRKKKISTKQKRLPTPLTQGNGMG